MLSIAGGVLLLLFAAAFAGVFQPFTGLGLYLLVPIFIGVAVTYIRRGAGMLAAAVAFGLVVGYGVVVRAVTGVNADGPDCDSFCMTKSDVWVFTVLLSMLFGAFIAAGAAFVGAIVGANRRPAAASTDTV